MKWAVRIFATLVAWSVGAWWLFIKHPWEGRVLVQLSATHGIHSHDVVGVAIAVVGTALAWVPWEHLRRYPAE